MINCTGMNMHGLPCRGRVAEGETACHAHGGALRQMPARYRCTGRNRAGGVCFAKIAVEGGRCFFHPIAGPLEFRHALPSMFQCSATNRRGTQCDTRVAVEGGRCPYHPRAEPQAAE